MSLVSLLLQELVRADGDAVVIHSGDTPYIDAPSGQTELSAEPLPLRAVTMLLTQLLPAESQQTLHALGFILRDCPPMAEYPGERFTVVGLHESDGLWVEIRREVARTLAPADDSADDFERSARSSTCGADSDLVLPIADEL